jgi:GTP-binding protein
MYVVDLPGYGYAAAPKSTVDSWRKLVADYLAADRPPRLALLLMDIRRKPQQEEIQLVSWLESLKVEYQLVATKCDKLSKVQVRRSLADIGRILGGLKAPVAFSSLSGQGREELIDLVKSHGLIDGTSGQLDE